MESTETINGNEWITNSALTIGDYGGCGAVGVANIRYILEQAEEDVQYMSPQQWTRATEDRQYSDDPELAECDVVIVIYAYGGRSVWVRASNEELAELVYGLSDYPLICDQTHNEVMSEREIEAWDNWIKYDLISKLDETEEEKAESMDDDQLFSLYRQAMDETNTYTTDEHAGIHVDIDRISDRFSELVAAT